MEIFLLISVFFLTFYFIMKNILYSAQRNLFKDHTAWSGRDINIKYNKSKKILEAKRNDNYLKIIADESKSYLEDQSKNEEE